MSKDANPFFNPIVMDIYKLSNVNVYTEVSYKELNETQKNLFLRVLHGIDVYEEEELKTMSPAKKRRINAVWRKSQKKISELKHIVCFKLSNQVFDIFYNSSIAKEIVAAELEVIEEDPEIRRIPFRKLGIDYDFLIAFFVQEGLLPKNFSKL